MKSQEHILPSIVSISQRTDSISKLYALPPHWFYEYKSQYVYFKAIRNLSRVSIISSESISSSLFWSNNPFNYKSF